MQLRNILIVTKSSELRRRRGSARIRQLLSTDDPTVARFRAADLEHRRTLESITGTLDQLSISHRTILRRRRDCPPAAARNADLVLAVGGDGTLLSVAKWLKGVPVLAVNSAPADSVGFFACCDRTTFGATLAGIASGKLRPVRLARLTVALNGLILPYLALNDVLFCHVCAAVTTRYLLSAGGITEEQRSSGLWISTPAGSTAGIRSAGGSVMPLTSRRLQYLVREPYQPRGVRYELLRGIVGPDSQLEIASKMHEGRLYLDGSNVACRVGFGDRLQVRVAHDDLAVFGVERSRHGR